MFKDRSLQYDVIEKYQFIMETSWKFLFLWNLFKMLTFQYSLGQPLAGTLNEYCHAEFFNPSCDSDKVIFLDSAAYGQMKRGRCIDANSGYLGCTSNQLINLDRECSGKQTCEIVVEDSSMTEKINCTIPKIFTRYLEAKYSCLKVYTPDTEHCTTSHVIKMKSRRINIVSVTTKISQCGLEAKPWVLEAKPGQKINISMTDFNWNSQVLSPVKCPVRYGYIIDVGINQLVDICGGTHRLKHVYLSEGSSVQVIIDNSYIEDKRYILSFEVVGCPNFDAPKDTWTRVEDNVITVGCLDNDRMWKMRCIGNHWIGIVGTCDKVMSDGLKNKEPKDSQHTVLGMSPVVAYSLLGGMFLVILCVIFTVIVGSYCIRKPKSVTKGYLTPVQYPGNTLPFNTMNTRRVLADSNQTLLSNGQRQDLRNNVHVQNSNGPTYFVLDNRAEDSKEPIYDAVYQNVGDINSN